MRRQHRVAAIYPTSWGFGYAVFDGESTPTDWGVRVTPPEQRHIITKADALLDWYQPSVLVLENYAGEGSRRVKRMQRLIRLMDKHANRKGVATASYSRGLIRQCFERFDARTKHDIAITIGKLLPQVEPRVPPERKLWMTEHYRMGMFDAIALALTFYHFGGNPKRKAA